jgi:hypothetical protein
MSHSAYEHPTRAMNRLAFLEGSWEGQGWHQAGPDAERRHFTQTEDIQRKLDGQLLIIEGRGHAADDPERVVHWAFAVVSYDTAEARYRWAAFSRGDHLDTDLSVDNTGIEWSAQLAPDTLMRYRANIIGEQWNETAQLSTDHGTTWTTTLEMHLRKTD